MGAQSETQVGNSRHPLLSPPFFMRENECKYELAEHGNKREARACGKEKSEAVLREDERGRGGETAEIQVIKPDVCP